MGVRLTLRVRKIGGGDKTLYIGRGGRRLKVEHKLYKGLRDLKGLTGVDAHQPPYIQNLNKIFINMIYNHIDGRSVIVIGTFKHVEAR